MPKRPFPKKTTQAWAVLHRSTNAIDGERSWLEFAPSGTQRHAGTLLFKTRAATLAHIKEKHGYIADRPDLKSLGWHVPKPVRVSVTVALAEPCAKRAGHGKAVAARAGKRRRDPASVQKEFIMGMLGTEG